MIVEKLREIQNRTGFLPDTELRALGAALGISLGRIEEVSTFFPAFRPERDKPARLEVRVCRDMTCHLRGASKLLELGKKISEQANAAGGDIRVEGVSCLGRCDRAPAMWVERRPMPEDEHAWVYTDLTSKKFTGLAEALAAGEFPPPDSDASHRPNTNADYSSPNRDTSEKTKSVGERAEPVDIPNWEMDVYASRKLEPYSGVIKFIAFLTEKRRRAVPRPPAETKDEKEYVKNNHPWLHRLSEAGLGGKGGAMASTYQKWFDVWTQRSRFDDDDSDSPLAESKPSLFEKYVIANGDESEPGTFKDREILLRLPHLVVEGVILAGLIVGASEGFIFIRHEYHEQIAAVRAEVERAINAGACGPSVFGSGRAFPVTVIESPGGYILGEQSALIEAMEDRRGQPRNKPPEITANGFRDRPTVLNNVETLAWVPHIMLAGELKPEYGNIGWVPPSADSPVRPPRFKGRRLFSVSGDVNRPGVYEVPIGMPLGELLNDPKYCGGVKGELKAVATSGPSGGFVPAKFALTDFQARFQKSLKRKKESKPPVDTSLTEWYVSTYFAAEAKEFDLLTAPLDTGFFGQMKDFFGLPAQPLLGAGLVVYAEGTDILDQALNHSRFFRNESCGKCVPCRIGSQKLVQLGEGLIAKRDGNELSAGEVVRVNRDVLDLTLALTQTSICSLGASAPSPLATALAYFADEVVSPTDSPNS